MIRSITFILSFAYVISSQDDINLCQYSDNRLYCRDRGLTSIPNNFPVDVLTIDLTRNEIEEIKKNSFANLSQLEVIFISINHITVIRNGSFSSLPNLKNLRLDDNILTPRSIEVNAFCYLPSLIELKTDHNQVHDISFLGTTFEQMPNIQILKFDVHDEFRFRNLYAISPSVNELVMTVYGCCYILRNDTFSCDESARIRKLSVDLTEIELGSFCNLTNIQELKVYIKLRANTFNDIFKALVCLKNRNLNMLFIRGNTEATVLGKDQLRSLTKMCISHLFLTKNSITDINVADFEYFASRSHCLQELDLSENPIAVGSGVWFYIFPMFTHLKKIRVYNPNGNIYQSNTCSYSECNDYSGINVLLPNTMQELSITFMNIDLHFSAFNITNGSTLSNLDLSYCKICSCDIVFHGFPNLKYLNTSGWFFLSVRQNFLQSFSNLETYISENSFLGEGFKNNINIKDFLKNSKNLQHINLHGNQLQDLPSVFFDPVLSSLKFLNLSKNSVTELPLAIHKFPKLRVVDLRHNKFRQITFKDQMSISKATQVKVYLSGNPFLCICNMLQYLLWKNFSVIEDYNKLVCTTEKGQSIFIADFLDRINEFEQHCVDKQWIILGSFLASIIVLSLLIGTGIYKYRHSIQYWYLMIFKRMNNDTETISCLYHAFLAYSRTDFDEVFAIMMILQNKQFNIAIDQITFVPGRSIAENIIDAIDNSRKIIFFVTQNFLESSWGSFEIEVARMHACRDTRKDIIIVVIKENIPKESLPSALKQIWRRVTCIEWPETANEERQRLFHQQLITSIRF